MSFIGGLNENGHKFIDGPEGGVVKVVVNYEVYGEIRQYTVTREVSLLKSDAIEVSDDLLTNINPLLVYVGKDSPINFGSDWEIGQLNPDSISASMMRIGLSYEKELQSVWDTGLPDSVTLGCTNGVVTLSFDGNEFFEWTTEQDCQTPPLRFQGRARTVDKYELTLFANGVEVQTWDLDYTGNLDPENNTAHRLRWTYSGTTWAKLSLLGVDIFDFSQ